MNKSGDDLKDSFYSLSPSIVLDSIEDSLGGIEGGYQATGFILPLNSIENRVFEIRFEESKPLIAKFYRPQRWNQKDLLSEHSFLQVLADQELPVAPAIYFENGTTLDQSPEGIFFAAFPKMPGRLENELKEIQIQRLALYLARIHSAGATIGTCGRRRLDPKTYFLDSLAFLKNFPLMSQDVFPHFEQIVLKLHDVAVERLEDIPYQRVHGDCHIGNVLWENESQPFIVDFDDMMDAPVVQDMWMLFGGREEADIQRREVFLESYEKILPFDRRQLGLIEILRAMRIVYYSCWIARRWSDPSFPKTFPHFGSPDYWREELISLNEILTMVQ